MKSLILVALILIINNAFSTSQTDVPFILSHYPPPPPTGPQRRSDDVSLQYFLQNLDHSNSSDSTIWPQRYYVNTEFFNKTSNNVVFLHLGGESPINENWMTYGSWITSAIKYGALLFLLEHRFYGESQPVPDLSTENLQYLTSEQALADAALFIKTMNEQYSLADDVKWIVFGGSYSGSLAAWMRLKYPDLVHGAVASSSPLLAKLDFTEYMQVTIDDMDITSETCVDSLKTAMSQVEEILNDPDLADETVSEILNVCIPIEGLDSDDRNLQGFYNRIAQMFSSAAQVNGLQPPSVQDLCDILTDEGRGSEIYRLADVISLKQGYRCLQNDMQASVEYWKNIYVTEGSNRQWLYQVCTEFGWLQGSVREDRVFGQGCPADLFVYVCTEVFGEEFNENSMSDAIAATNEKYGGTDIEVSNVVFVQGSFDPWHPVGLTETKNPEAPVIYIEGTSHCADMYDMEDDSEELIAAKKEIDRLVGEWLGFN